MLVPEAVGCYWVQGYHPSMLLDCRYSAQPLSSYKTSTATSTRYSMLPLPAAHPIILRPHCSHATGRRIPVRGGRPPPG
eukprot:3765693-Rhodomonas_salina.1